MKLSKMVIVSMLLLAMVFAMAVSASAEVRYNITDLGYDVNPIDINNSTQVVGATNSTSTRHAFVWQSGTMTDLGTLGGNSSYATAINSSGVVVGIAATTSQQNPFKWENGTMTDLTGTPNCEGEADDINDLGVIVGKTFDQNYTSHLFTYSNGNLAYVGNTSISYPDAINSTGEICGSTRLHTGGTDYLLPGLGVDCFRTGDMNAQGQIAGNSYVSGVLHGAIWTPSIPNGYSGTTKDLGSLGGNCYIVSINAWGQAVGCSELTPSSGVWYACVYNWSAGPSGALENLNNLISSSSGWVLQQAKAINDKGEIVGIGKYNNGITNDQHGFLLTPVQ